LSVSPSLVRNVASWTALTIAAGSGCLIVTPLEDLPEAQVAGSAQGGSGGKPAQVIPEGGGDSASGAGGTPASGECRTNADCAAQGAGAPYLCRASDRTCAPLLSEACPLAYDGANAQDPNAIFFGAFAPLSNVRPGDNSIIWAHRLALQELNGNSIGGVPGGPGGARRPLVMVVCNNADASVAPAFEHLIEELEVPAILATLRSGDLREQYEKYRSRGVFYLSPIAVSSVVASEDDGGRIWNLLGQPSDFAPTYRSLLERAEAYVRTERNLGSEAPLKVALIGSEDALDYELANSVTPGLMLNGKPASADPEHFMRLDLPAKPDYAEAAAKVGQFHPDIVLSAASEKFSAAGALQAQLEADWETYFEVLNPPRPLYILSPYNAGNLAPIERRIEGWLEAHEDEDDQHRYVGISVASAPDSSLQNAYAVRLASAFGDDAISDTANYYDAVYYLAYAMFAAKEPDGLTGTGIAEGMRRLGSGQSFEIGPTGANPAFAALAKSGATIKLESTLGPPGFDPVTGVRPIIGSVFCFRRSGNNVSALFDQLRYDSKTSALIGELSCVPGF
jgi:hypothetical protein